MCLGPKNQNIKYKQYCNKFSKGFENEKKKKNYWNGFLKALITRLGTGWSTWYAEKPASVFSGEVSSQNLGLPWWLRWLKHLPAMWETWIWSLGQADPLEKEMATHSSPLSRKIPWTEEPGRTSCQGCFFPLAPPGKPGIKTGQSYSAFLVQISTLWCLRVS